MSLTRRVKMMLAEAAVSAMTTLFSRFAAVYRVPGRQRRPPIWFTRLADAGPPAGSGEWSFSSQSRREQ